MKRTFYEQVRASMPQPIKVALAPIRNLVVSKSASEMAYWRARHRTESGRFSNDHYERIMLAMASENDCSFLKGKVVADFGCGPRGSLQWAEAAGVRIGIDILAAQYAAEFPELATHNMIYVPSSETIIPMPDDSVDIMFTMNALDHVGSLEPMCIEILRVLRPGALFVGSFNLNEKATAAEPQTLNEQMLEKTLLRHFTKQTVRFGRISEQVDRYKEMFTDTSSYEKGQPGYMWFSGRLHA